MSLWTGGTGVREREGFSGTSRTVKVARRDLNGGWVFPPALPRGLRVRELLPLEVLRSRAVTALLAAPTGPGAVPVIVWGGRVRLSEEISLGRWSSTETARFRASFDTGSDVVFSLLVFDGRAVGCACRTAGVSVYLEQEGV